MSSKKDLVNRKEVIKQLELLGKYIDNNVYWMPSFFYKMSHKYFIIFRKLLYKVLSNLTKTCVVYQIEIKYGLYINHNGHRMSIGEDCSNCKACALCQKWLTYAHGMYAAVYCFYLGLYDKFEEWINKIHKELQKKSATGCTNR